MIAAPSINHYNTIIFNPIGQTINPNFIPTNIYYHDGNKIGWKIVEIKHGEDWRIKGIPYIVLNKKFDIYSIIKLIIIFIILKNLLI